MPRLLTWRDRLALPAPASRQATTPAWSIEARAERGLVRKAMEDAFAVVPQAACPWLACDAIGVFDGVGGLARGGEAAQAAASALGEAVAASASARDVLPFLHERVLATGGATTAVVALLPHGDGDAHVLWAGDSSAYALGPAGAAGAARPLTVPDSQDGLLRQCLGLDGVRPHAARAEAGAGTSLLLCTDGVDGVVGAERLARLVDGAAARGALDPLLDAVAAAGAPDNATAVLARRLP